VASSGSPIEIILGAMTGSLGSAVQGRRSLGARFLFRVGRRTLIESLYLLTAPVIAAAGLLLVLGGLCLGVLREGLVRLLTEDGHGRIRGGRVPAEGPGRPDRGIP